MSVPGMLPPAAWGDAGGSSTLIQTLQSLGLTSGLQLCLDAGDASSYSGSGQTWSDVSGNSNSFYRGSSSGSDAADPTFNGAAGAGAPTNYWSFDGGDYFKLVAASNPAWVETLHKNSAKFAFAGWFYHGVAPEYFFASGGTTATVGVVLLVSASSANKLKLSVLNAGGGTTTAFEQVSAATFSLSGWQFFGLRVDEASNTMTMQIQGVQETYACAYSSPSAASATDAARIGASGTAFMANSDLLSSLLAWQGTIPSAANLTAIYNATKASYGL